VEYLWKNRAPWSSYNRSGNHGRNLGYNNFDGNEYGNFPSASWRGYDQSAGFGNNFQSFEQNSGMWREQAPVNTYQTGSYNQSSFGNNYGTNLPAMSMGQTAIPPAPAVEYLWKERAPLSWNRRSIGTQSSGFENNYGNLPAMSNNASMQERGTQSGLGNVLVKETNKESLAKWNSSQQTTPTAFSSV